MFRDIFAGVKKHAHLGKGVFSLVTSVEVLFAEPCRTRASSFLSRLDCICGAGFPLLHDFYRCPSMSCFEENTAPWSGVVLSGI